MQKLARFVLPTLVAVSVAWMTLTSPTGVFGQTATATPTATATATATNTATATATATGTATATATGTATATATGTATATATSTPVTGRIINGFVPQVGYGLIVFGGGTFQQLISATACGQPTLTYWATSGGSFIVYVPNTTVTTVNDMFNAMFPGGVIPAGTALLGRCA